MDFINSKLIKPFIISWIAFALYGAYDLYMDRESLQKSQRDQNTITQLNNRITHLESESREYQDQAGKYASYLRVCSAQLSICNGERMNDFILSKDCNTNIPYGGSYDLTCR